ncbi:MAG TPA: acetylxylan esterase [Bryobacteraceae bacterium]|nr:acetylxylan esterase [Bryobacteraceae bacterium]
MFSQKGVMRLGFAASILVVQAALPLAAQTADRLDFLAGHTDFREIRRMLPDYCRRIAFEKLDARRREIARLTGPGQIEARKRYVRERMQQALGGLPERTPLNARVTGAIEREHYRIEKIVFESQPNFFVTANLYLPKTGKPPYPAILFPLGHEAGGKSNPTWQQFLGSVASKGFVALAWDPLGQGERVQLYDEDLGGSKVVRSTTEHTILGTQCLLVGDNLARYTIWDGLRALDYLLSRKEVDPQRVGCTGNSGGGTHTAYLAALDDRIQVAAPSCYLTSWGRLLETIGPQDAEQCLLPWLAAGLDHADFIHAFAPKPYLVLAAIRDFFSIVGTRGTFHEAGRIYELLGARDKLAMVEADDGHGYSRPRRLAAYRWFSRWLKGSDDEATEPEIPLAAEEELYATPTGQVATSLGGETVFTLNRKRAEQLRRPAGVPASPQLAALLGFVPPEGPVKMRGFGEIERSDYRIEKIVYESEPGIAVPALVFVPKTSLPRKPAAIYVDGRGKAAGREDIEALVKSGWLVLSIDARGFGETRHGSEEYGSDWPRYFGDYDCAMTALLAGRTLVGMRALDIVRGVDLLAQRPDVDSSRILAFGVEAGAVPLLHAAAFDARMRNVALERMLASYDSVVRSRIHRGVFEQVIPAVLRHYDLPELAASLNPRPVWVVDPAGPAGGLLAMAEARQLYGKPNVRVLRRQPEQSAAELYRPWLE